MLSGTHAVMIMAKAPFPGEAKTRLAESLGVDDAAYLYKAFLLDTVAKTQRFGPHAIGVVCPNTRHQDALAEILPEDVTIHAQTRPGLMAGITEAASTAFSGGATSVLITEGDSPSLPLTHLEHCLAELREMERGIVLGPCDDGGYYLVGAIGVGERECRDVFEGEIYHGTTICRRTAERARSLGLQVAFGPEWYDIDTLTDLHRLVNGLSSDDGRSLAHTQQALASIALPPLNLAP